MAQRELPSAAEALYPTLTRQADYEAKWWKEKRHLAESTAQAFYPRHSSINPQLTPPRRQPKEQTPENRRLAELLRETRLEMERKGLMRRR